MSPARGERCVAAEKLCEAHFPSCSGRELKGHTHEEVRSTLRSSGCGRTFQTGKSLYSSTSGAHGEGVLSLTLWRQADYTVRRSAVLTAARDKWFRGSANFVQTGFRRGRVRVSDLSKPLLVLPAVRKHPFLTRESAI